MLAGALVSRTPNSMTMIKMKIMGMYTMEMYLKILRTTLTSVQLTHLYVQSNNFSGSKLIQVQVTKVLHVYIYFFTSAYMLQSLVIVS